MARFSIRLANFWLSFWRTNVRQVWQQRIAKCDIARPRTKEHHDHPKTALMDWPAKHKCGSPLSPCPSIGLTWHTTCRSGARIWLWGSDEDDNSDSTEKIQHKEYIKPMRHWYQIDGNDIKFYKSKQNLVFIHFDFHWAIGPLRPLNKSIISLPTNFTAISFPTWMK